MDVLRRAATARRALPLLLGDEIASGADATAEVSADAAVPDDRLRLIFTCCHPTLSTEAQVALALRLLCGLSTADVARVFLVKEATMAARLTRAKKKITAARIPYRVPDRAERPARVAAVCEVVHLLFTTGHTAPAGDDLARHELTECALNLAWILRGLLPDQPEVIGLLALILLTDARRAARVGADGAMVLLADQDRSAWDSAAVAEGAALVRQALSMRPPGRYALMAAIAAVHDQSTAWEATDWTEIVGLYDVLIDIWPSPVVALNRAVAAGLADGPAAGLRMLDELAAEPQLAGYHYLAASRADFLARLGRHTEARQAYEEALMLTKNLTERTFLTDRLNRLASSP